LNPLCSMIPPPTWRRQCTWSQNESRERVIRARIGRSLRNHMSLGHYCSVVVRAPVRALGRAYSRLLSPVTGTKPRILAIPPCPCGHAIIARASLTVARDSEPGKLGISHRLWKRRAQGGPVHIREAFEFRGALRAFPRLGKGNPLNFRFHWRRVPRKGVFYYGSKGLAELFLPDFRWSPYGRPYGRPNGRLSRPKGNECYGERVCMETTGLPEYFRKPFRTPTDLR